jgi:hypothetical protein
MAGIGDSARLRWALSGALATFLAFLLAMLFRVPSVPPPEFPKSLPAKGVTLVREGDRVVTDESILLDPTPLFLPTKWNSTQRDLPRREAVGRFQGYDTPKFTFAENELKLRLPPPIKVPASVAEAVAEDIRASPLVGFGRKDSTIEPPPPRGGFVEIVETRTGRKVLAQSISTGPSGTAAWQPMEYLARIDAAGLVGRPVVTSRSGVDEVDAFFANYLVRTLRIGERLEPGFYRISIGP